MIKSLKEIQDEHFEWLKSVGWAHKGTNLENLMFVVSECGEAADELRGETYTDNFEYELADIILRTCGIASRNNIDITKAINAKMKMNLNRGTKGRTL